MPDEKTCDCGYQEKYDALLAEFLELQLKCIDYADKLLDYGAEKLKGMQDDG